MTIYVATATIEITSFNNEIYKELTVQSNRRLVIYNERDVVDSIDNKTILQQFQSESSKLCKNLKCNK